MSIGINDPLVEVRYANWLSQIIAYVAPQHLQVVAGRGTSKTTQIIAERMQEIVLDMPGSLQILICNTYTNARTNIVPSLITGWQNYKGWIDGRDFVVGIRPPNHWKRCYTPLVSYKNAISFPNGVVVVIGSLEMVSGLAGNSYQHAYADEVKYDDKSKIDIIIPALRGNNHYPHSPYYLGTTFATDLPNLTKGNHDWVMEKEKDMDLEKVKIAFYVGHQINEINKKIINAIKNRKHSDLKKLIANKARWMVKHFKVRKNLSMFMISSTFANIDVLSFDYIKNMFKSLGEEEFKQSVLSIKSTLEAGDKFYTGLDDHHFYASENAEYSESLGLKGTPDCQIIKNLQIFEELDAGVDFGKMISMVIGQEKGKEYHCLKNFYTLVPQSSRELADHFIKFFKPHKKKVLNMYYDRSGNQYESNDRAWSKEIKDCIEILEDGSRSGWRVNLMSKGQATIYQAQEYMLLKNILEEKNPKLPKLRIDKEQCRELKSSMEMTKIKIKTDVKTSKKTIHKDKSSEKLTLHQLPMNSTNMSDGFKYLMYRKKWANVANRVTSGYNTALDGND